MIAVRLFEKWSGLLGLGEVDWAAEPRAESVEWERI